MQEKQMAWYRKLWCNNEGEPSAYRILFIVMCLYSLAILWAASLNGLNSVTLDKGYRQSLNWSLYPLFWMLVIPFVRVTWHEFLNAWASLFGNGVIDGKGEAKLPAALKARFDWHRRFILIPVAIILAAVVMSLDTQRLQNEYATNALAIYQVSGAKGDKVQKIDAESDKEKVACQAGESEGVHYDYDKPADKPFRECEPLAKSALAKMKVSGLD
jgi:hypothetical protein